MELSEFAEIREKKKQIENPLELILQTESESLNQIHQHHLVINYPCATH